MDENKIAFIICTNNKLYCDECVGYIDQLIVPEGYSTDVISITEADDICSAYNAAMKSSDAKYKIYLHHDVFIYNREFIKDILKLFQSDPSLGMLGVLGGINLPQNAVIWNAWNVGRTLSCDFNKVYENTLIQQEADNYVEVEAIDGMIMVTQYDLDWREDLNLGWDFYDISQSLEFRRRGYKIGVPYQKESWCMHDCGHSKLMSYDTAREIVLKEYNDFFSGEFEPVHNTEIYYYEEQLFSVISPLLMSKKPLEALRITRNMKMDIINSNNLQYALNILEIYEAEQIGEVKQDFLSNCNSWEILRDKYDYIKFLIRHIENDTNPEYETNLINMIKNKTLSKQAVWIISKHSAVKNFEILLKLISIDN